MKSRLRTGRVDAETGSFFSAHQKIPHSAARDDTGRHGRQKRRERCQTAPVTSTTIGSDALDIDDATLDRIFALDPVAWDKEADLTEEYFKQFGKKMPQRLRDELDHLRDRIGVNSAPHNA